MKRILLFTFLLIVWGACVQAQVPPELQFEGDCRFTWNHENPDNDDIYFVVGYGQESGNYTSLVKVGKEKYSTCLEAGIAETNYYYVAVKAVKRYKNQAGEDKEVSSGYSNETLIHYTEFGGPGGGGEVNPPEGLLFAKLTTGQPEPIDTVKPDAEGNLSFDLQSYTEKRDAQGHSWKTVAEGIQILPNTNIRNDIEDLTTVLNGPRVSYPFQITKAGIYYVWIYGRGFDGKSDSVYLQFNDVQQVLWFIRINQTRLRWENLVQGGVVAKVQLTEGLHELHVLMREDGFLGRNVFLTMDKNKHP